MKLFEKIKNFFYDEEEVPAAKSQPKVEEKKEIPREETKEPMKSLESDTQPPKEVDNVISERELFKSEPTFKFPVIFEEDDFVEEKKKTKSMNVLEVENNKARSIKVTVEETKTFRPSPIISPIYGVLDKNYKKDDVTTKNNNGAPLYEGGKKINLDQVIEKAYGRYQKSDVSEDDFVREKSDYSEVRESSIDLFKDITDEISVTMTREEKRAIQSDDEDDYILSKAENKLKTIDELLETTNEQDFYTLVDSMYKDEEEESNNGNS